jgi:flap endonuclease-1
MGVDGLYKFINKKFPDIYTYISINDIKGKSCIIDGMQHIYSQLIYMRSRNKEIFMPCGTNVSHIHGLINSLTYYLKNGIIPIFIFDGKSPKIKEKKVEERKLILKENLKKLKELEESKNNITEIINFKMLENELYSNNIDDNGEIIYGTPPDNFIEEELQKISDIRDEYHKIYKKSIILKDYYIKDWIEILELLGLPVIKATGEADPLCAYILKNNEEIFGIISDDSDMLVFGAPILMRKSINQQFTIIKLDILLNKISELLNNEYNNKIDFTLDNLIDFSIFLGTDYGSFKLKKNLDDTYDILKFYIENEKDYKKIIYEEDYEYFNLIKSYYKNEEFEKYNNLLKKPIWEKPKLLELKKRLLELKIDEEYIDKNNEIFNIYFSKIKKNKFGYNYDNNYKTYKEYNNELTDNIIQEFACIFKIDT